MSMRPRSLALAFTLSLAVTLAGCATAPAPWDPTTVCRLAQAARPSVEQGSVSLSDLIELSRHTPAYDDATSARRQRIAGFVLGGVGAGALIAGFVMGFAIDSTQTAPRDAGYGLVGGAIGMGVGTWILSATSRAAYDRARGELSHFSQRCE